MGEYAPEPPPITLDAELQEYLQRELSRVGDTLRRTSEVVLSLTNVSPPKPEEGTLLYADGTNFNPGAGKGFYSYINGAWVKLGSPFNTIDLLGGQIKFPAVQNPSANANTLDDYEEGIGTPTLVGTTTAGVGTYTQQTFNYIKIGKLLFMSIRFIWTAHTGTGNFRIDGMPFSLSNDVIYMRMQGVPITAGSIPTGLGAVGTVTSIVLEQMTAAGVLAGIPVDNAGDMFVNGIFTTPN